MADDDKALDWLIGRGEREAPATNARDYAAFKPVDRSQARVHVCPRGKPWEWLPYASLQRIVTDADQGTRLGLIWSFAVVVVTGRHLQPVAAALARERCEFLREFDAGRCDPPADRAAPFIDSIVIHVEDRAAMAQAEGALQ